MYKDWDCLYKDCVVWFMSVVLIGVHVTARSVKSKMGKYTHFDLIFGDGESKSMKDRTRDAG